MNADPQLMRKTIMVPGVETPRDEKRERHDLIHIPFAPWCEICVRSQSRGTPHPHLLAPMDDRETPLVCMDLGRWTRKVRPRARRPRHLRRR